MRIKNAINNENAINILIVDDSLEFLEQLKRVLRDNGFNCMTCNDPYKALQIIKDEKIDIIVVDYLMVGMTGIQLIEKIREKNYGVYAILLTGHSDLMPAIHAMKSYDIDSFSEKTSGSDDILLKIYIAIASFKNFNGSKTKSLDGMGFRKRLKFLREKNNLTQDDLAKALNVSRATICNYELGANNPTHKHLRNLADYFGVTLDSLIQDIDSEPEGNTDD